MKLPASILKLTAELTNKQLDIQKHFLNGEIEKATQLIAEYKDQLNNITAFQWESIRQALPAIDWATDAEGEYLDEKWFFFEEGERRETIERMIQKQATV